jgi:hypothetical protein
MEHPVKLTNGFLRRSGHMPEAPGCQPCQLCPHPPDNHYFFAGQPPVIMHYRISIEGVI